MTETKIDFPQPEVEAPKVGATYYAIASNGEVGCDTWSSDSFSLDRLAAGNIYLTRAEAEQRAAWNKQDMARRVVPKWFRDLGPDVEVMYGGAWIDYKSIPWAEGLGWDEAKPENFRAKPKPAPDVVVTVNGREYRWPATAKRGDPRGDRFFVDAGLTYSVYQAVCEGWGNRTHHTREGAESQCAALNAALGIEQGGAA